MNPIPIWLVHTGKSPQVDFVRRDALRRAGLWGALMGAGVLHGPVQAQQTVWQAKNLEQALKSLGAKSVGASTEVRLNTLDYAENGSAVPVDIATQVVGAERLVLFVDKNPTPLVAVFQLTDAVDSALTLHTKLAQTTDVVAAVITRDGRALYAKKEVKVVLGSCGSTSDTADGVELKRTTEPTRIRAQWQGESSLVRMRMAHAMESGQRKNAAGKLVPAWHIEQVTVSHNGKTALAADWGPGVSFNPYLQFTLKKARPGEKITVAWRDNKGLSRSDDMLLV